MIAFIDFLIFLLPLPITGNPWHVSENACFCSTLPFDSARTERTELCMTLVLLVNLRPKFLQARQEEIGETAFFEG